MVGQELNNVRLSTALKVAAFVSGIALVAIALQKFATWSIADPADFFLTCYYVIFGVLVCLAELPFERLLDFFAFLGFFIGRALFLLFLGTLVFTWNPWYYMIIAIVLWMTSGLYFVLAFTCSEKTKSKEEPKEAKEEPQKKKEEDKSPGEFQPVELEDPPNYAVERRD